MKSAKRNVRGGMRVRAYEVLHRAIEEGTNYGWRRAHKHTDAPGEDAIKDQIVNAVLSEIGEYFDFDEQVGP